MAEATGTNEVKIEDVGPAKKRLTITIPAETINEKLDDSMGTLAAETSLPGFRKGRAPRRLLERRFGDTVRKETKGQLVADAYAAAIEEHEIRPVGEPEPVEPLDDLEMEAGKPLTFSLDIEVVPEFDLPDLEGIPIKKPVLEIADSHIDQELERHRIQIGQADEIERDFQPGDRLLGYATVTKKGEDEPFFHNDNILIVAPEDEEGGRGQVLGIPVDGLAGMLQGKQTGEKLTIKTKGPDQYEREYIRGVDLTIAYEIRSAHRVIPATIEQVVENYGLPSEDILREQIKLSLEQRRDEEQTGAMREQVFDYLIEKVDVVLPEKLSAAQAQRTLERQKLEMLYRGASLEEVEQQLAEIRAESEVRARQRLKLTFILHKLADHFSVEVSEQEINGRIAAIAAQRGVRPEQLRSELVQNNELGQIRLQIREHKTADRVIQQADITEITTEQWQKIAEEKSAARAKRTTRKKTPTKKKTTRKSAPKKQSDGKPASEKD